MSNMISTTEKPGTPPSSKFKLQTFHALRYILLWLSILALVIFGISQNWVGATVITLAQLRVPPQMRGRVMSLNTLLIMGVRPLGDFPAGALIALIGGPFTVIISASIVGSYSLYLLIGRPVIRNLKQ